MKRILFILFGFGVISLSLVFYLPAHTFAAQRSSDQVCQDNGGTPNGTCTDNGTACLINGQNLCCYGDAGPDTNDGACYGRSGIEVNGNIITNTTGQTVTVNRYTQDINNQSCPLRKYVDSIQLAPGASMTVGTCEQLDVVGYTGICLDTGCGFGSGPTPTTPPSDPGCPSFTYGNKRWVKNAVPWCAPANQVDKIPACASCQDFFCGGNKDCYITKTSGQGYCSNPSDTKAITCSRPNITFPTPTPTPAQPVGFIDTIPPESDPSYQWPPGYTPKNETQKYWCKYQVDFGWNKAVTQPKITIQSSGGNNAERDWCGGNTGKNCNNWSPPVTAWTYQGNNTIFRLYNGNTLLDSDTFVCHVKNFTNNPSGQIYVNPKQDTAVNSWCTYDVFFEWNQVVKSTKVTYEHIRNNGSSEGEVTWCQPGANDCRNWSPITQKKPVQARTYQGKSTTFRLYDLTTGTPQLLSQDTFTCLPPNTTPTPNPTTTPTLTPTPTPTPVFQLELIDVEGHSGSSFANTGTNNQTWVKIINQATKTLITSLGVNFPRPTIKNGPIYEKSGYTNRIFKYYTWKLFTTFLPIQTTLKKPQNLPANLAGTHSIDTILAAAATSGSKVVLIESNLNIDRSDPRLKNLLILVEGNLNINSNLPNNQYGFFIVKGNVTVGSSVKQLHGVIISFGDFIFNSPNLNLSGSFISRNIMDLRSNLSAPGNYRFQPNPNIMRQLIKLNLFTNKVFRIFTLKETSPVK